MSKKTKKIFLGVLVVLIGAAAWFSLRSLLGLSSFNLSNWPAFLLPFVLFIVFLALASVAILIIEQKAVRYSILAAAALVPLLFFNLSWVTLIGSVILFLASFLASLRIRTEYRERVKLSVIKILRPGLGILISGVLIVISLSYYSFVIAGQTGESQRQKLISLVVETMQPLLSIQVKSYTPEMTVDEFLLASGQSQESLPAAREEYGKRLGAEASADETMVSFLSKVVDKKITSWFGSFERFIPSLIALSLFFALQIFSFLYKWLIHILVMLIFWLFRLTKFATITREQQEVERITL